MIYLIIACVFGAGILANIYVRGPAGPLWAHDVAHALEHVEYRRETPGYSCGHCFLCKRAERLYGSGLEKTIPP